MWEEIAQQISAALNQDFQLEKQSSVFGGDINQASRIEGLLEGEPSHFFIKLNRESLLDMFEAEADGLREIENSNSIYVPHVVCSGVAGSKSFPDSYSNFESTIYPVLHVVNQGNCGRCH